MSGSLFLRTDFSAQQTKEFRRDRLGRIVQNAVTTTSVDTVSLDRDVFNGIDPTTSERLDSWSVTNQRHSGRCWEFAGLNVIRAQVMRNLNIDNLEFSQNHIAFFDKIEKVNFAFARAVETIGLPDGDEQVRDLLGELGDGGYWPQFVDIVGKYGLVPQWAMPDTESSGNTGRMNRALEMIVRRVVGQIRAARGAGDQDTRIAAARQQGLKDAWRVLAIHLGTPPTSFTWQYRDKDKNFHREGTFTPTQFARHIIPGDLGEYATVQHDPRTENPVGRGYVREHTPYMVGRPGYSYVSAGMDDIKALAVESIRAGDPVWFSCDVNAQFDRELGIWDANLHDYEGLYGVELNRSKADRMRLHETSPTHAMTLVGVDLVDGAPVRWRVENSWGEDVGTKGFFTMNDNWFDEYVFEVVVPRSRLSQAQRDALDGELTVMPYWDVL